MYKYYVCICTDDGSSRLLATKDYSTNHTVVSKPDCLYGPQVIDVIMRKPGKITIIIDLL